MQLRDYQVRALDSARMHYAAGKRSVLLVSPTGSGKTIIGAAAALGHHQRQGQVVWLAHRVELIKQAVDKLWKAGIKDLGAITAEGSFNERAQVVVASTQTLLAREIRPKASLLIPDEAHHYLSAEWSKVAGAYGGVPVLGLTATPQRADGTALGEMFDALVSVASVRELVDAGHLVPIETIGPPVRLDKEIIDPVEALEKHAPGRRAVIFASSVGHGRALTKRFGETARFICGTTPAAERASVV